MKLAKLTTLYFLSSTCTVNAAEIIPLEQFPKWFKDASTREKEVKKHSNVKIEELNVKAKILGKAQLSSESEGTWYYIIDIGTNTPVECYAFTEFDGSANSLYAMLTAMLPGVEKLNNKKLSSKHNLASGVGMIDDTPYMHFDMLYSLGEGNKKVTGVLKGRSAQTESAAQVCIHNEIGYQKTFQTVFDSFVKAFKKNDKNTGFFQVVTELMFNDLPVGFGHERFTLDSDGDVEIKVVTSMLLPVDTNTVMSVDTYSSAWSRPDGSLINANEYSVENRVLSSNLAIQAKEGKWQVEGEIQGKPISKSLAYDGWLLSDYGTYLQNINLIQSEKDSVQSFMWISDLDPTQALPVNVNKINDNVNANLKMSMGPLNLSVFVDKNGLLKKGTMKMGGLNISMKSIYSKGSPQIK